MQRKVYFEQLVSLKKTSLSSVVPEEIEMLESSRKQFIWLAESLFQWQFWLSLQCFPV